MLHYPIWGRIAVLLLVIAGLVTALPDAFYSRVEAHNDAITRIAKTGATPELNADLARWPDWMPSALVNLGLDLRGGAQLLAEVQVEDVYAARMDALWPDVRDALRKERDVVGGIRRVDAPAGELRVRIANAAGLEVALKTVRGLATTVVSLTAAGSKDIVADGSGDLITVQLSEAEKAATDNRTIEQSLEIIRRRIDAAGTREPSIQRIGDKRILVQVPGVSSAEELKSWIGTTAKLTFNPVISRTSDATTTPGPRQVLLPTKDQKGLYYLLEATPVVTGEQLVNAQPSFDQNGLPAVSFRFDSSGARKFGEYTSANVGKPFAIVLDNEVISAPTIQTAITGGSGIITGSFTVEEANNLAVLLRAGALPAKMTFLEERTIGPELGADSIQAGKVAAIVAFVAVLAYMFASYGWFGLIANVALLLNVAMMFGLLSTIGATLTLPGIAGIVLTIGMAVDANVLIFERIREELRGGRGPARAIELGYEKALSAIIDANLTTVITAGILFFMGSGPVQGFAVTLFFGIITSVFAAIFVTRLMIVFWFERRRPKKIEV